MDHRMSEKVFESYDMRLDFGRTTPALIVFANGRAYPAKTGTLGPAKLVNFLNSYSDEEYCQYCGQVTKAPQSELSMYLEYAKNEVQNSHTWVDTYNYVHANYKESWFF